MNGREMVIFFLAAGPVMTLAGLAAWTGKWRSWAYMGRGYRVLAMLPCGIAFLCFGFAALVPEPVVLFLLGLGFLCLLTIPVMLLLTFFIEDRWYPRWYHKVPGRQW